MMKKMVLALFGLVVAFALVAPPKASAAVRIGIGVGLPGYVAVQPGPYYPAPAYYGAGPYYSAPAYYGSGYAYAAPVYGGVWYGRDYGYHHDGWRDHHEGYRQEGHHGDGRHYERR